MKIQRPIFPFFAAFFVACVQLRAVEPRVTNSEDHSTYMYSSSEGGGGGSQAKTYDKFERILGSDSSDGPQYRHQTSVSEEKPGAWFGVAISEASEALASQLKLDPGVGLLVNYVTTNSPAAAAGLKENDVLVEFDGQKLVHPAQLRKLVAVRKEGDSVKITYYRGGEKKTAQVKLGTVPDRTDLYGRQNWDKALLRYESFVDSFPSEELHTRAKDLQKSLHELQLNQTQMQADIRRSIEDARRTANDALRNVTNEFVKFGPAAQTLEGIARGLVRVDKDTTLTLASSGNAARTMVKADDTGTYVIVANPKKHLTVHDPAGKLLFDGEIETPEQQSAVPKEIWAKVESMANKVGTPMKFAVPAEPRAGL